MRLTDLEPRWFDVPGVGGAIDGVSFLCPCAKCVARGDATHRCKVCGARWRFHPADPERFPPPHPFSQNTWSLESDECGECCDVAPMLEQIEPLQEAPRVRLGVQFTPIGEDRVVSAMTQEEKLRHVHELRTFDVPPGIIWKRTGETFDTLTLTPSINAEAAGHWHGFITNGDVH